MSRRVYTKYIKRFLDIALALVLIVVLLPLFLILSAVIKIDSKGPILYRQKRVKQGKTTFSMVKFRTMRIDAPKDTPTHLLTNPEKYISRTGRLMRKLSLDETVQVFHCLGGSMSFVGPRPALWNQDDLIAERDKYGANDIKPGITGWAQINGRDELPIEQKAKLDGYYAQKISLWLDIKCIIGTIINVFGSKGVVEGGTGTLEKEADQTGGES